MDDRAKRVANWLAWRFRDHPRWFPHEIDLEARQEGIDLAMWMHHPAVEALGIETKHQHACGWLGGPRLMWCRSDCPGEQPTT